MDQIYPEDHLVEVVKEITQLLSGPAFRVLGPCSLRNVRSDDNNRLVTGELEAVRRDLDINDAAILAPMTPFPSPAKFSALGLDVDTETLGVIRRPDVRDRQLQELFAGVSVVDDGGRSEERRVGKE